MYAAGPDNRRRDPDDHIAGFRAADVTGQHHPAVSIRFHLYRPDQERWRRGVSQRAQEVADQPCFTTSRLSSLEHTASNDNDDHENDYPDGGQEPLRPSASLLLLACRE